MRSFGGKVPRPGSAIGKANHYDETTGGGTTTLIIDPDTREITVTLSVCRERLSTAAAVLRRGEVGSLRRDDARAKYPYRRCRSEDRRFPKPHGYCFEVPASANTNLPPVPLKAMGRFTHEAIAVDKSTGIVYLTEDLNPCGFIDTCRNVTSD
jgi:hypothetical protein